MDPTDVVRALWQQRRYVLPAVLLVLVAVAYVYQFAPRTYESTATYALVNPAVPTPEELEADPELAALDADNPYLRSSDTNLIADALIARLGASSTVERLEAQGIGSDYGVGPGVGGNGFVVDVTGVGPSPEAAVATTAGVGAILETELRDLQKVNGADDRYLFTPLLLTGPDGATEQFSSRLRAVIVVGLGGGVLVFAAVSLGRWRDRAGARRRAAGATTGGADEAPPEARSDAAGPEAARPDAARLEAAGSDAAGAGAAGADVAGAAPAGPEAVPAPHAPSPTQRAARARRGRTAVRAPGPDPGPASAASPAPPAGTRARAAPAAGATPAETAGPAAPARAARKRRSPRPAARPATDPDDPAAPAAPAETRPATPAPAEARPSETRPAELPTARRRA
ncbi:hypothetical protein KQI48_16225 [Cellulomonas hominis]|uniref:hypothetical protein n=1 Tax=Cellulomonas hominis TaxID=156981 RepID=UPI001C10B176|nr:hypothetical protein [Cellulomonas hominis]MBU5424218.1 hypothetical protein [Cellulomonas hominis]